MHSKVNVVLLAGGKGTRLWPISNHHHPKQFVKLPSLGISCFQLALKRSLTFCSIEDIIITANSKYKNLVEEQIVELGLNLSNIQIILEHFNLNTGIAIYDVCDLLLKQNNDYLTYFFPTDHIILEKAQYFHEILPLINTNKITIFGEEIKELCSNFGYIVKENYSSDVAKFIEKPNASELNYLETNFSKEQLYKNLGIYLAKPSVLKEEYSKYFKPIHKDLKLSIDKMIIEKSSSLSFMSINFQWQDIGSMLSLYQYCNNNSYINCKIDIEDISCFNEESKEFELLYQDKKLQIIKK